MALIKTGQGIIDIRGSMGGVTFARDKTGLHIRSKPRRVHQRTSAQNVQRNTFTKIRAYTRDNRWVSYYIYRLLNNLPLIFELTATGNPVPNCKGIYLLGGVEFEQNWYHRADNTWFLWNKVPNYVWYISTVRGVGGTHYWYTTNGLISTYNAYGEAEGDVKISLELQPPPIDYSIPKL